MSLGAQTSPLDDNSDYLLTKIVNKFSSAQLVTCKTLRQLYDKSDTRRSLKTCTHLQCIVTCLDRVCTHSVLDVIKCVNDYRYLIGHILGFTADMIFLTPQQHVHQNRSHNTNDLKTTTMSCYTFSRLLRKVLFLYDKITRTTSKGY
jgi:hypothetical protein